jgi:hypothetical protein
MTKEEFLKKMAQLIYEYEYDEVEGTYKDIVGCTIIFTSEQTEDKYIEYTYNGEKFTKMRMEPDVNRL